MLMDLCSSNFVSGINYIINLDPFCHDGVGGTSLRLIVISLILDLPMGFIFTLGEDMKLKKSGPMSSMEENKSIFWAGKCEKKILSLACWYFYFSYRGRVEWDVKESAGVDCWSVQGLSAPICVFLRARENEWPMHFTHF